jgi:transcriptional regulator with XRE-family HTH domain
MKVLYQKIAKRRESLGMTQQQLAAAMETSQANVSRIETGDQTPSLKTLAKLARILGYQSPSPFIDWKSGEKVSAGG